MGYITSSCSITRSEIDGKLWNVTVYQSWNLIFPNNTYYKNLTREQVERLEVPSTKISYGIGSYNHPEPRWIK